MANKKNRDRTPKRSKRSKIVRAALSNKNKENCAPKVPPPPMVEQETGDPWSTIDDESIMNHQLTIEKVPREKLPQEIEVSGYRVVNLNHVLKWSVELRREHKRLCTLGELFLYKERFDGLVSYLDFKCSMCSRIITRTTEEEGEKTSLLNTKFVWGTLSAGSSFAGTKELLSVMDVPAITCKKFAKIENDLGKIWHDELFEQMKEAGKQERQIALELGNINDDGIPFITVYLDGGWSKRSYGHNYNAASGVAVIIGKQTKKLLHIGVRNKYCCVCARAANKDEEPKAHNCFRNWTGSSSAMENDIIIEGFNRSLEMHGLQYKYFIADGDSSTFANIKLKVSYGRNVTKIECANHCLKNYSKHLYNLKNDKRLSSETRSFLKQITIKRLTDVAKHALSHNCNGGNINELKNDLLNGPKHIFGCHDMCKPYYCSSQTKSDGNQVPQLQTVGILQHIENCTELLVKKAGQLIDYQTNNRSELYMSLLAKYNVGKRLNLTQRGSFEKRCYMTGLVYNNGSQWHTKPLLRATSTTPGVYFQKHMDQQQRRVAKGTSGIRKRRRRQLRTVEAHETNRDYGKNALQPELELDSEEFISEIRRTKLKLQVTPEQAQKIALDTVGQFGNDAYEIERRDRLTASMFGQICKRRKTTPCDAHVTSVLYPSTFGNKATKYGKTHEKTAIRKFLAMEDYKHLATVTRDSGLHIYLENGALACSPDGLVGDDALLEVKCLYSVFKSGKTLEEAAQTRNICLRFINGRLQLKRNHSYYYQIQGQLNITQRNTCYFVVYLAEEYPIHVEVIRRDVAFWNTEMLPKLQTFYNKYILPEIVLRRVQKGLKCLEYSN